MKCSRHSGRISSTVAEERPHPLVEHGSFPGAFTKHLVGKERTGRYYNRGEWPSGRGYYSCGSIVLERKSGARLFLHSQNLNLNRTIARPIQLREDNGLPRAQCQFTVAHRQRHRVPQKHGPEM